MGFVVLFCFEGRCGPLVTVSFSFLLPHTLLFWAGVQDPDGWELSGIRVPPAASTLHPIGTDGITVNQEGGYRIRLLIGG